MVLMSASFPLNEKADVVAATCNSLIRVSELSNSSVRPSEKYSWLGSPLMLTNGSTAGECGGAVNAMGVSAWVVRPAADVGLAVRGLSTSRYAVATAASTATSATHNPQREGPPGASAGRRAPISAWPGSPDNSC